MHTAEFEAVVKDGKIELPRQYQGKFFQVKVFVMDALLTKKPAAKSGHGFGALTGLANPALWDKEQGA
jgi:hypothetical protein